MDVVDTRVVDVVDTRVVEEEPPSVAGSLTFHSMRSTKIRLQQPMPQQSECRRSSISLRCRSSRITIESHLLAAKISLSFYFVVLVSVCMMDHNR